MLVYTRKVNMTLGIFVAPENGSVSVCLPPVDRLWASNDLVQNLKNYLNKILSSSRHHSDWKHRHPLTTQPFLCSTLERFLSIIICVLPRSGWLSVCLMLFERKQYTDQDFVFLMLRSSQKRDKYVKVFQTASGQSKHTPVIRPGHQVSMHSFLKRVLYICL